MKNEKTIKSEERKLEDIAAAARAALLISAIRRLTITFGELAMAVRCPARGIGPVLAIVAKDCKRHREPKLHSLVGYKDAPHDPEMREWYANWIKREFPAGVIKAQEEVFAFDWFSTKWVKENENKNAR